MPPQNKKPEPVGPMVAIVVVVLVLIVGGIYFFAKQYVEYKQAPPTTDQANLE